MPAPAGASPRCGTQVLQEKRAADRGRGEPTFSVRLMAPFLRALGRGYLSSRQVEQAAPPDADARIPVRVALELLEQTVALTGDPAFGLRAALETDVGDFELFEYVAASSPTLGDSIPLIQRYV